MEKFSSLILRIGMGLVFLWFGFSQLSNATPWISFLPSWTSILPISKITFIHLNGWFEVTFALLLVSGFYTRLVSLLLSIHLFGIAFSIGLSAIGVRDFGLAVATLSLALQKVDIFTLDSWFNRQIS